MNITVYSKVLSDGMKEVLDWFLQFKESLSNISMIKEMMQEDNNEVQKLRQEQYELESKAAELKARATSLSKRKRARIISNNNNIVAEYEAELELVD